MNTFLFVSGTELDKGCKTGAHRRFVELIHGLSRENKVILVSGKIQELVINQNIQHCEIVVGKIGKLPHSFSALVNMMSGLRKVNLGKYDYAVSFGTFQTLAYVLCGKKNIVTLLREDTIEYQKVIYDEGIKLSARNFYQYVLETIVVLGSKGIIVQCKADYDNLLNRHKLLKKRLERKVQIQINNIASWMMHDFKLESKKEKSDDTTIVFVGGFNDRRKGHEILFPAVERLIKEGIKLKLLVAGDGELFEAEKGKYAAYKEFVFLGRVSNMDELYAQADFAIVPSLQDSCPNTVLEALAYGVPVYGTNTGGIPDLLEMQEYLFEPNVKAVYEFVRMVVRAGKYKGDAVKQKKICDRLDFCWEKAIQEKIEHNCM